MQCECRVYEQHDRQRYGHVAMKEILPSVMSISRARSWPLLNTAGKRNRTVAVDDSSPKKNRPTETNGGVEKSNIAAAQPENNQVQAKQLLCRRYYPEGGWGWVVTFVGTLVHILGPGLQFSIPATVALPAKVKFYHHPWHTAGESRFLNDCVNVTEIIKIVYANGTFRCASHFCYLVFLYTCVYTTIVKNWTLFLKLYFPPFE
ncbi:PREDICTED: uncharacterized protein LOC105557961 [Vollenhovia emeryi]|uniref:uncharacterized protein LOC105557961 n=1 Tax=Vollenhovia emeryi TaxID=411798 RepID=UPI0005F561F2|nr:PREDICTED: uncharacterized protein LOC105557961 [Vollenhovia emeryi]